MSNAFTESDDKRRLTPHRHGVLFQRPASAGFFMAKITYLVNIPVGNDTYLCGEVRANTWDEAEAIAVKEGYELLGPMLEEVDCEDTVEAMIQSMYSVIH